MKSFEITENSQSLQSVSASGFSTGDRVARSLVLQLLKRITRGRIVLEDGSQVHEFGESDGALVTAHLVVTHPGFYRDVVRNGTIGAAEAYMAGRWVCPDLVALVRVIVLNMQVLESMDNGKSWLQSVLMKIVHKRNPNSSSGSRRNIAAHYDLSNKFFATFLDETMMYSAAIFHSESDTLQQASVNKLHHVCQRLQLRADDHLLEIGTGWGSMAIHAAQHYGCRVTTTTLSQEQFEFAQQRIQEAGLQDRIKLLLKDYRELEGSYDKLVSIEMIEAVGHEYYKDYFSRCAALLRSDGLMLLQGITISDQRYQQALKSVDFIQRYIFPGGCLPSNAVIAQHVATNTDMQIIGLEDITRDYAMTLAHWRQRFQQRIHDIQTQGFSTEFIRMWDYYLAYCQGGFKERVIHTAQILLAKPDFRDTPVLRQLP